jgi:hypothetical protein
VCIFNNVASNTVTVAGLDNTTIYDLVITYHDDSTDTHTLTTSGSGVMTMAANTDAKFTNLLVKSVAIYADGGTPLVDTVNFSAQPQGTRTFTTGGARTVTVNTAGTSTAEPTQLFHGGTHLWLPGSAGNYASVPDEAALDIVGDIDLMARCALVDWSPAVTVRVIAKHTLAALTAYDLYVGTDGKLNIAWYDGTLRTVASTAAVPDVANSTLWIRATLDVDNGAGGHTVTFYTGGSAVAPVWVQLGNTGSAGAFTTSIRTNSTILAIGALSDGTNRLLNGLVYAAQIYSGIAGTKVLDIDFTQDALYNATQTTLTALSGQTVTINRSATGLKSTVVDRNKVISDGADDYIGVDDHPRLDATAVDSLTIARTARIHGTPAAEQILMGKKSGVAAANAGYQLTVGTSREVIMRATDGTDEAESTSAALVASGRTIVVGELNRTANTVTSYLDAVPSAPANALAVGDCSNAVEFRFFTGGAGANFCAGELESATLFRRILTAAQRIGLRTEWR